MGLGRAVLVAAIVGSTSTMGTVSLPLPDAGLPSSSVPLAVKVSLVESPALPVTEPVKVQAADSPEARTKGAETGLPPTVQARSGGTVAGPPSMESLSESTVTGSVATEALVIVTV